MIQQIGNRGVYIDGSSCFTFSLPGLEVSNRITGFTTFQSEESAHVFLTMNNRRVLARGANNRKCEDIEHDIKRNRLLPSLLRKQVQLLYGKGVRIYIKDDASCDSDGMNRQWVNQPEIQAWLESWEANGLDSGYSAFAEANIKNYYYFRDSFVRWRFSQAPGISGALPVVGLEALDNKYCRLASERDLNDTTPPSHSEFRTVLFGNFSRGTGTFKEYPRFRLADVGNYRFAAISHHRESSPGGIYGENEIYEGIKRFLKTSNAIPEYVDSFLANSLAAKVHIDIPYAWVESKRRQIKEFCKENEKRVKANLSPIFFDGIDVGTEYKESTLVKYTQNELRRLSLYLSGSKNQGKAYATTSFTDDKGNVVAWKIETLDLKYKEYIESLIAYDKRTDEVLVSSVGMSSAISGITKPNEISKSGSDTYYSLLLYLMTLTLDDERCSEPFNLALQVNFPHLYKQGYRIGYYRPIPAKQQEVSPSNRLDKQNDSNGTN